MPNSPDDHNALTTGSTTPTAGSTVRGTGAHETRESADSLGSHVGTSSSEIERLRMSAKCLEYKQQLAASQDEIGHLRHQIWSAEQALEDMNVSLQNAAGAADQWKREANEAAFALGVTEKERDISRGISRAASNQLATALNDLYGQEPERAWAMSELRTVGRLGAVLGTTLSALYAANTAGTGLQDQPAHPNFISNTLHELGFHDLVPFVPPMSTFADTARPRPAAGDGGWGHHYSGYDTMGDN